jgi:hypothetical protein
MYKVIYKKKIKKNEIRQTPFVLSVLLRFTDSDYPLGIFKNFSYILDSICITLRLHNSIFNNTATPSPLIG